MSYMKTRFTDDSGKLHKEWFAKMDQDHSYIKQQEKISESIKDNKKRGEFNEHLF